MGRDFRGIVLSLSALLSALWLASPVLGIENCAKGKTAPRASSSSAYSAKAGTSSAKAATSGAVKKDPAAAAFALPSGVVLNARQQQAYNKLRQQNEAPLRAAIQGIQSNNKDVETKSLRQAKEIRSVVRTGMKQILAMPAAEAQQRAMNEYNREYAARKAAKARAEACACGKR